MDAAIALVQLIATTYEQVLASDQRVASTCAHLEDVLTLLAPLVRDTQLVQQRWFAQFRAQALEFLGFLHLFKSKSKFWRVRHGRSVTSAIADFDRDLSNFLDKIQLLVATQHAADRNARNSTSSSNSTSEPRQEQQREVAVASEQRLRDENERLRDQLSALRAQQTAERPAPVPVSVSASVPSPSAPLLSWTQLDVGEIALFLPTARPMTYAAFHRGCPHRYLTTQSVAAYTTQSEDGNPSRKLPDFILSRIARIDQQVASASANPFDLPIGTPFYLITLARLTEQELQVPLALSDAPRGQDDALRISFTSFRVQDVALFFVTSGGQDALLAAFHHQCPNRFLSPECAEAFSKDGRRPSYVIGRIIAIDERVATAASNPCNLRVGTSFFFLSVTSVFVGFA